jgi:hypothetical protein
MTEKCGQEHNCECAANLARQVEELVEGATADLDKVLKAEDRAEKAIALAREAIKRVPDDLRRKHNFDEQLADVEALPTGDASRLYARMQELRKGT